jgi:hypothetical protein
MQYGIDALTMLGPYAKVISRTFVPITSVGQYLKNCTLDNIKQLQDQGISVWFIFEIGASDVLWGAVRGRADGMVALEQIAKLNLPPTIPIYLTADTDVVQANLGAAIAYFNAFDAEVKRPAAGYADGLLLSSERQGGMKYAWLPDATGWEGYAEFLKSGNPTMVQGPTLIRGGSWGPKGFEPKMWPNLGVPYDPNFILADNGAWGPTKTPQPPSSVEAEIPPASA